MDLKIRELTPEDPTMAEAIGWTGRNLCAAAFVPVELLGDVMRDVEVVKRGLGLLALAGICEVVRYTESRLRRRESL